MENLQGDFMFIIYMTAQKHARFMYFLLSLPPFTSITS